MAGTACAILVAAGSGSRFAAAGNDSPLPKQFLELKGKPVYTWSLRVLMEQPDLRMVVVVTLPEMIPAIQSYIAGMDCHKSAHVTAGGATRQESVLKGLNFLSELYKTPDIVLIHDAARPFLTSQMLEAAINGARMHGAITTAVPVSDTVKTLNGGYIAETLDRESLVLVQTPQAGRFDWLLEAHRQAAAAGLSATDDATILEAAGHRVAVVPGSAINLKITRPEDLRIAEAIAAEFS